MRTYTVIALCNGVKIGGQSDATYQQVVDLVTDERGVDKLFMLRLTRDGKAMQFDRYKVLPWDKEMTTSVLVAYRNQ